MCYEERDHYPEGRGGPWARIKTAERNISVSRLLGEILQERMQEEEGYQLAMEQYLAQSPLPLKKEGQLYPKRKELYER